MITTPDGPDLERWTPVQDKTAYAALVYFIKVKSIIHRRFIMKWTGVYLIGYILFIIGILAALWEMGVLASIGMIWTLIGVVILTGLGIMIAVSHSGTRKTSKSTVNNLAGGVISTC